MTDEERAEATWQKNRLFSGIPEGKLTPASLMQEAERRNFKHGYIIGLQDGRREVTGNNK